MNRFWGQEYLRVREMLFYLDFKSKNKKDFTQLVSVTKIQLDFIWLVVVVCRDCIHHVTWLTVMYICICMYICI